MGQWRTGRLMHDGGEPAVDHGIAVVVFAFVLVDLSISTPRSTGARIRLTGIGDEHLNPAVRIGPLEVLHGSDERYAFVLIEHRAGMVRECRARG